MELRQYFSILWKWLWLIVLATALAAGTAFIISSQMTPIYQASTTLLINEARNPGPLNYNDILTSERTAKTYAERLTKRPVLKEVAKRTGIVWDTDKKFPADINIQPVRDTQLIRLGVEHPNPQLAADIANTLPKVFGERNEEIQAGRFASSKENLSRQLNTLKNDIDETTKSIDTLRANPNSDKAELSRLQSALTQYQSSYSSLLKSYEDLRLAEAQSLDNIIIDEPALVPKEPVKPQKRLNTLLAAVVGAMLAVGVAFLMEYLDDTIKTPDDIRQTLGISPLGAIARIRPKNDESPLIAAHQPRSPISEAYRVLRTNLQFSSLDKPLKTLLITSASPTEGKSTTAANLGVVMAQAGLSVIVVDSDLRRPVLHKLFDLNNSRGLTTSLLQEGGGLDGCLQETGIENLKVLTSGPLPPNPSELLGSQRMRQLIEQLKGKADAVVFDSPPALAVTDAAVLGNEVDGVLLVVGSGQTRREVVQRARETLTSVGATVLGATLNKLSERSASGYYYYYYYATDGQGAGQRRKEHKESQGLGAALRRLATSIPAQLRREG